MNLFLTRTESAALRRCISMLQVSRSGFALSLLLGVTALGSAIALGGTAAWLIARASQQPPVLYLTVAATAVRTRRRIAPSPVRSSPEASIESRTRHRSASSSSKPA